MSLNRILYVGALRSYQHTNTTISRLKALNALGLDVVRFDTTDWWAGRNLLVQRVNQRTYLSSAIRAMNVSLCRAAMKHRPDVVWIDKGVWIYPWTLWNLHRYIRFLVHYNTDDVFGRGGHFWLHRVGLRVYDLYLTTNRCNVLEIRQRYGGQTMRVGMGCDQDIHTPPVDIGRDRQPRQSVVFVGHWEPHTEMYINALRRAGLPVRVWGYGWGKAHNAALRAVTVLPGDEEYVATIAAADIALCFLSRRNRNESTGRSFEIPAIGTFMLAERTAEHEFLYGDGMGAVLFSDEEEMIAKARYYLAHAEERQTIATVAYARCQALGLSWAQHMQREWPIVERLVTGGRRILEPEDDQPFWAGFRQGQPFCDEVSPKKVSNVSEAR